MSEYLIISFDVYNNPMCTTTHTVIKIILCYAYHFFDLLPPCFFLGFIIKGLPGVIASARLLI